MPGLGVRLSHPPPNGYPVTVALAAATFAELITFSPAASVVFGAEDWNVTRDVRVDIGSDGGVAYGQRSVLVAASASSITSAYDGVEAEAAPVTVADADEAGVVAAPAELSVPEGASAWATTAVRLTSRPLADVTVGMRTRLL